MIATRLDGRMSSGLLSCLEQKVLCRWASVAWDSGDFMAGRCHFLSFLLRYKAVDRHHFSLHKSEASRITNLAYAEFHISKVC